MPSSESVLKRSSSLLSGQQDEPISKRPKRAYHHHHRLQKPVNPALREPAVTDDVSVDQLMDRAIATSLNDAGFDMAHPVALESIRQAAEECTYNQVQELKQGIDQNRCSKTHFICPSIYAVLTANPTYPSRFRTCPQTPASPRRRSRSLPHPCANR